MSILPLPDSVCQQIKSSIQITTLSDVVEELVRNSLDANATSVEIEIDFRKGFCSVQDDGVGIPAIDFSDDGNLARPNCTSKLEEPNSYGRHGCFLSYLSSLSLTSIASRREDAPSGSLAFLGQSTTLSRRVQTDDAELKRYGTRVVVHNLFGNLPVRLKHLASRYEVPTEEVKAFDDLKRRLVAYLLASGEPIHLRLRTRNRRLKYTHRPPYSRDRTSRPAFSIQNIENVFKQAGFTNISHSGAWKLASAKAGGIYIRAAICLVPSPSKHSQFVALGYSPIPVIGVGSPIYETINALFDSSQFGGWSDVARPLSQTAREYKTSSIRKRSAKSVDRWPRYFVKIDTKPEARLEDMQGSDTAGNDVPPALRAILDLVKALLTQFLEAQDLKTKGSRSLERNSDLATTLLDRESKVRSISAYNNWKRLKYASYSRESDARHDLPFANENDPPVSDIALGDDVRLLLRDMDLDPEACGTSNGEPGSLPRHPTESAIRKPRQGAADLIFWTDRGHGEQLQVNPDNGCSYNPSMGQHQHAAQRSIRRLQQAPLSRADLAERLKQWPTAAFRSTTEQGIHSVLLHDETSAPQIETSKMGITDSTLEARRLANAVVVGQIDAKFILAMVPTRDSTALILVDQHAADERVKAEVLFNQLCTPSAVNLAKPINFEVTTEELKLLARRQQALAGWSIEYDLTTSDGAIHRSNDTSTVTVTRLPAIIAERCRLEPKILIELLRKEIWSTSGRRHTILTGDSASWISKLSACPDGLVEMINSRACRTAVMFNDILSEEQCKGLLTRLSQCELPFQCAHGRPTMTVLTSPGNLGLDCVPDKPGAFGNAYEVWCGRKSP